MSLLLLPLKVLVLLMCVGPHYLSTSCAAFNSFATLLKARCTVFYCFNKFLRGGLSTVTMEHLSRIFFSHCSRASFEFLKEIWLEF
jgi:hypothetical protein